MKKLLVIVLFFSALMATKAQDVNIDSLIVVADSSLVGSVTTGDSLRQSLDKIIDAYVAVKTAAKALDGPDGVNDLVSLILSQLAAILPILLWLITKLFLFLKKSPAGVQGALSKGLALVRTKWFVATLSGVIGAVWSLFVREGHYDLDILSLFSAILFTFFTGLGIENFSSNWVKKKA